MFKDETVLEAFGRTCTHLEDNHLEPDKAILTLGAMLKPDPAQEKFAENPAANGFLTRDYRKPFVVPDESQL